jgi:hypothetical protein
MKEMATELANPPNGALARMKTPATGAMWPTVTQVCGDGLADIGRQRHGCGPTTFTVDSHLAGFPIDIFQIERNNFSGPQAQSGE